MVGVVSSDDLNVIQADTRVGGLAGDNGAFCLKSADVICKEVFS